jgi:hypothetical protein
MRSSGKADFEARRSAVMRWWAARVVVDGERE